MTALSAKSILITGASSGLGEGLALALAAPGVTLFLCGRDAARLDAVAERCRQAGAQTHPRILDVAAAQTTADWIRECDQIRPLDLVVANAGISAGTGLNGENDEQSQAIFAVNLHGVLTTAQTAIHLMQPRRSGQIALISSQASFRGMPGAPSYCASKAAVRIWGEGMRGWLSRDNIRLSVVCPGFVTTRMTEDNRFPMPFLMDCPRAVRIILRGLARDRGRIAFPLPMNALCWLAAALPDRLMDRLTRALPLKR